MSFTQGHALVIGVGAHQYHREIDVPITVTDANAVAAILRDASCCGYPAQQVHLLHNASATKLGILAALDDLARLTDGDDTILFFYAGHGAQGIDGAYYLVSHDTRLEEGRVVAQTGVSEGELLAKLKVIRAERMLLIFNACHSGNISPSLSVGAAALQSSNPQKEIAAALLGTGQGRIIITACREAQVSYIGNSRHTIFSQALLEGLNGKGEVRNNRGFISAFSLYEQIYTTVTKQVKRHYLPAQEPELTVLKGIGPFAVALYQGASTLGDFSGEPLAGGMAVNEVEPDVSAKLFQQRVSQSGGVAYTTGSVATGGGDFINHQEIVRGDKVRGNKLGGVSIGNVSGGIHGSVIAGRDAKQIINPTSGAATSGETKPTFDKLRQLLTEIQQDLAAVITHRDALDAISPDALDTAQGVDKNIKAVANALQPALTAEQAQLLRQRLDKCSARLGEILADAKTLAEKREPVQPLSEQLATLIGKIDSAALWIARLWLSE